MVGVKRTHLLEQLLQLQPTTLLAQWIGFPAGDALPKNSKVAVAGMACLEYRAYQEPARNDIQSQIHPAKVMGKPEAPQK